MDGAEVLCRVEELLEGCARGFDPLASGADSVFALRSGGLVRVYRNSCPHLNVPMEYRKDRFLSADGQWVVCYAHGARFQPETGLCVYGPCLGEALSAVDHRIENGWLVISLNPVELAAAPERAAAKAQVCLLETSASAECHGGEQE